MSEKIIFNKETKEDATHRFWYTILTANDVDSDQKEFIRQMNLQRPSREGDYYLKKKPFTV